ncbi:MAG: hypothetical protein ACR2KV_14850 [Solirubrobacteraceae bacterium]
MRNPLCRARSAPTREFSVTVLAPARAVTIEAARLPVELGWDGAVSALLGAVEVPADATAYRLLDLAAGTWIDRPATVADVAPTAIALVHEQVAAGHDEPAVIARMVRENPPS